MKLGCCGVVMVKIVPPFIDYNTFLHDDGLAVVLVAKTIIVFLNVYNLLY